MHYNLDMNREEFETRDLDLFEERKIDEWENNGQG